jgi:GNAT superfamily N-acetyltransferase
MPINPARYVIRHARSADIPAIRAMQERSMCVLGGDFYSTDEIAQFVSQFGTMDDAIVDEGHFFVAEDDRGAILGSGGWTRLRPAYARGLDDHGPAAGYPTIRSVFVDPAAGRRGIGTAIMRKTEHDAIAHGHNTLHLTATLSGVALYKSLGYRTEEVTELTLPNEIRFACVKMAKHLSDRERAA